MDAIDRSRLAQAYANAWLAVKGTRCEVTPQPYGWFELRRVGHGLPERVRAANLIIGLDSLTGRLARGDVAHGSPLTKREAGQ